MRPPGRCDMADEMRVMKAMVSTVIAGLTALWGWLGWLVAAWAAGMVMDYLSGSAAALEAGSWSSKAAREGIWHKLGEMAAVLVSGLLDLVLGVLLAQAPGLPFEYSTFLCPLVVVWYILTEAGSIIENAGALGAPLPRWLSRMVEQLRQRVDESVDGRT